MGPKTVFARVADERRDLDVVQVLIAMGQDFTGKTSRRISVSGSMNPMPAMRAPVVNFDFAGPTSCDECLSIAGCDNHQNPVQIFGGRRVSRTTVLKKDF